MENNLSWNQIFLKICHILRQKSACLKYQTSAIIVKNNNIISTGYNNTLVDQPLCCNYWYEEWLKLKLGQSFSEWVNTDQFKLAHSVWSECSEIHAEINALNNLSKSDIDDNCILYTYYSPCQNCAKHIINYGIKQIYYHKVYTGRKGVDALKFLHLHSNCVQIPIINYI